MPGYRGYHAKKKGWNRSTTIVVVAVHLLALYGLYQLSRTNFLQDLIKVTKLTTMPEPPKPPEPPPSEPAPEPEALPEPTPPEPLPPTVKELPPEPVESAPAEEPSQAPDSEGEGREAPATDHAPFAIGKGGSVFSGYEGILTAAIQAAYQQPPDLPDNVDYAVMCQLVLDEDGYVLSYQLLNSSGHPVFDRSAQLALSKLRQVRPPPPGMSRTIVVKFFPP
ncbi:hypothetical protein W02_42290 [Nitrospira sp. KM1]|uniref:TonB family protein n=1 Tax=Nitrospira sp. KM1 TaxID=1936990 RepID=UPI0013A78BAB|nr:TonB family protein [Nitrospira sp. KM1]BCA57089.1 hypothetical protein W02_42290 [Nitrospira sp. KM1]